ncbi:MAG: cation-transporting P-type ATPase [Actinomycetota bacterium]
MAELQSLTADKVYEELKSSRRGLREEEAEKRLEEYGPNEIPEVKKTPLIFRFLFQFYHLFAVLLWIGGALAFIGGMPQLGWAIIAVIFINAIFSFWQEHKAERATEALKKLMPTYTRVIRDGDRKQILATELVPGDIIFMEEGDHISADARVVEEFELRTNNATLTGESEPSRRTSEPIPRKELPVVEIPNFVFSGTTVATGNGKAVVFATGMATQFGRIAYLTQTVKEELSPLQKEMTIVTKIVAVIATLLGILFYLLGTFVAGLTQLESFLFAVGIIVANVPEGLLPTVSLALAMGVQRMARRHALIKKLSSVETLGSTTVICTDKTGTLTQNEMTVREIFANGKRIDVSGVGYNPKGEFLHHGKPLAKEEIRKNLELLLRTASFCNNARLTPPSETKNSWSVLGDPTEAALLVTAKKGGFDYEEETIKTPRIYELPFESVRKRMTTIHKQKGQGVKGRELITACVKGAPKEVLDLCTQININGRIQKLDSKQRSEILKQNDEFAKGALRVLAFAYRNLPSDMKKYTLTAVECDFVFTGLMAMMDPPRPEVEEAVKKCEKAGIRIIMITGDYGLTAESIARRIKIVKKDARIVTGAELDKMNDTELQKALDQPEVIFARVNPEHKLRVTSALKERGETVAVTGDGVNDAPALKRADIGVAMGITGTDVAKEAADMILTDDNFASIVSAIEEGRAVYDNIRRFVTYIFTSNIPEIVPFILFVVFRIPLPLVVMQILAIDLGTDMLPALALGIEAPEPGVMERPPRPRKERLLNRYVLLRAYVFLGPIQAAAAMLGYFYMYWINGWGLGLPMAASGLLYIKATTMTHVGVVTTQIGNAFAQRTNRESVFKIGLFSNRFLLWGIAAELVMIFIMVYVEPFQSIFHHGPLELRDWLLLFSFAPLLFIADEIRKFIVRRWEAHKKNL